MLRKSSLASVSLLAGLTLLFACTEHPVAPPHAITQTAPDTGSGWIVGRDGMPLHVVFSIRNGRAIWEGDIDLGPVEAIATVPTMPPRNPSGPRYNAIIDGSNYRWPNGTMPYVNSLSSASYRVTNAIALIQARVKGVRFVAHTSESNWVDFVSDVACASWIGKQASGSQTIKLATGCGTGSTMHEIAHALGVYHEQSRCDRDTYVEILWGNIEAGQSHNFDIACAGATDLYEYDEGSLMHYGTYAFSANGLPTIRSLRGRDAVMGQRDSLALVDIKTLRNLYPYYLTVGVDGSQFLFGAPQQFTWNATASGGTAPYTATWQVDDTEPYGDSWQSIPAGDGTNSLTLQVDGCDGNFALRASSFDSDPWDPYRGSGYIVIENWLDDGTSGCVQNQKPW